MARRQYFWIMLGLGVVFMVSKILSGWAALTLESICAYFALWSSAKRFHDMERSGADAFFLFIPLVGIYFAGELLFRKGTDGPNRYGRDRLNPFVKAAGKENKKNSEQQIKKKKLTKKQQRGLLKTRIIGWIVLIGAAAWMISAYISSQ